MIINFEEIENFCKLNDFVIITDELLDREGMYKNFVYATENNFVGKSVYPKEMPIMINEEVWKKVIATNNELKEEYGLSLKLYDAYRPIEIQKIFWEDFYNIYGYYDETLVANPEKYGTHNITINAVDISIVNLDGSEVELPCEFDDFTEKANIYYDKCSPKAKENRNLLISIANKHGLLVNADEWWHYYDNRLENYGMKYNYANSEFIPQKENEVFILKIK